MKKGNKIRLLLTLALALCMLLCACADQPQTIRSAAYQFDRVDQSIQNESGETVVQWFFDKLVITDETPAAERINADMEENVSSFFDESMRQQITEYAAIARDSAADKSFFNTAAGELSYNDDGIISARYTYNWFMGGVHNLNYDGFTYDLNTGEKLYLADLLPGSEEEILRSVQEIYGKAVREYYGSDGLFDEAEETLETKPLDAYKFYVSDGGELYLIADTYEFAPGASGPYAFASGLRITRKS